MQIAINISEEIYEEIKTTKSIYRTGAKVLCNAIVNGMPLPKGHGTLKDVDNIKTAFPTGEYVRTESLIATIDHEDTIIEADKTDSE